MNKKDKKKKLEVLNTKIERAYERGEWDKAQRLRRQRERLRKLPSKSSMDRRGLDHNARIALLEYARHK